MKKFFTFLLIFALLFAFTACAEDTEEDPNNQEDEADNNDDGDVSDNDDEDGNVGDDNDTTDEDETMGEYNDGTYTALGDEWEYGQESSTVVIEEGEMVSVDLKRLTKNGDEVDYDNWTGEEIDGKTYPNLKEYRKTMADRMIEQQTYNVDTIAGATVSTKNWKVATKRALEEASK